MDEDLDMKIKQKEAEFSPFIRRMEELKGKFIEETIHFASEWYRKTAKEYVIKYPEVLLSLKEPQAAQMKTQVSELVKNTEKTVKTEMNNPALWWHQKPRLHESIKLYLQISEQPPEILDRAVRHVLGHLGEILEEYNFNVSASGTTSSYKEFWFDRPLGVGATATPSYPHLLTWSREMQQIIQEYSVQYVKATPVYAELYVLREEKKKQQATDLWESI
jgi:vacuolar-type H+-ATPase subunit H